MTLMNYLILLASLVINVDSNVIEQSDVSVSVSDFDSYIYLLPDELRGGIAHRPKQIEKNLITILNKNIVFKHIENTGLINIEEFKNIDRLVEEKKLGVDDEFLNILDLERKQFESALREFILKQEYYVRFKSYLYKTLDLNKLEKLASERFLLNSSLFKKPKKINLSVIQLDSNQLEESEIINLIKSLRSQDKTYFISKAKELSKDPSLNLNDGNWGDFHEGSLHYPFSETVFASSVGVIPNAFRYKDFIYIIRVNDIIDSAEPLFSNHKDEIMESLKEEIVEKKIQDIINATGKEKIDVNVPLMADFFERYKVFSES